MILIKKDKLCKIQISRKCEPQASPTGEWNILGTESWNSYERIFNPKSKSIKNNIY